MDLERARAAVGEVCRRTPLVPAPALGEGVHLKLEGLQRTGSFKLRGAVAALAVREGSHVVAASAGNHGAGIALAARRAGRRATVVVPETCPPVKRAAIAALGAEVLARGRTYDEAEAEARALPGTFVSAFDDPAVMLGNGGTLCDEILEQLPGVRQVIVPVGGGGLCAGLCARLAERAPHVRVAGAQPEANCAMSESLREGRALTRYEGRATLCEGLEGPVAERTYAVVRDARVAIALASEAQIRAAVAFAYRQLGVVVEPSAAVGIALVRERDVPIVPPAVVVLTGSNIEPDLLDEILAGA